MGIKFKILGLVAALYPLVCLAQTVSCTSDNSTAGDAGSTAVATGAGGASMSAGGSPNGGAGAATVVGSSGTGSSAGGASAAGSTGSSAGAAGGPTAWACANPIVIPSTKPGIANFDNFAVGTSLATWSFALGADSSTGVLAGTFGYGDQASGMPATFEMAAGHASMYAMRIADPMSMLYGGGMGLWLSACLNATAFTGVSFWVRGSSPSPTATFSLGMGDTLSSTPSKPAAPYGTCTGTSATCINPTFAFPVTDAWTQVQAPWTGFKAGDAAGTPVTPTGKDITQLQWGAGLIFVATVDGGTDYMPVPGAYELAVDDVTFY